jgi:hypothetical protein
VITIFGGGPDDPQHPLKQRAEARAIRDTCTPATWRPMVAWAAGVSLAQHAINLRTLPLPRRSLAPESRGATRTGGGWDADRTSFRIWEYTSTDRKNFARRAVLTLTWPEIERLVALDLIGSALHEQISDACRTRRDRTPTWDPRRPRDWHLTAEAQLEQALWREIEAECERLGALAWRRCRPARPATAKPVQPTLFDLAAA